MTTVPQNAFWRDNTAYQRDLNIIAGYVQDTAKYLQLQTGQPLDKCLEFVRQQLRESDDAKIVDPKALVLERKPNGDRDIQSMTFMGFLKRVINEDLLLSPSMAAYVQPTVRESTHALYIKEGVAGRKAVKKEMLAAEQEGNEDLARIKDGEQNVLKINNNSYSGATVSQATILHYKSTHSSLTSTCRTATTYANAANEKFLAGNRHYYTPDIAKANMVSIINLSDLDAIQATMTQYGLKYPTVEDTVSCIRRSTEKYLMDGEHQDAIRRMIMGMTEVERAAVVYVGDLYHLHKYNPEFTLGMLRELAQLGTVENPPSDEEYYGYHDDVLMLANFLCSEHTQGRPLDDIIRDDPHVYNMLKNTARQALFTLDKYKGIIQAFWLTQSIPSSVHAFPSAYRRTAVISDTDSTMFTMQYWVEQAFGYMRFQPDAQRLVFGLVFLVTELIAHVLAIQTANMGVKPDKLRLLSMKNEYYFSVLAMTTRSKHYFAAQDAREGVWFKEFKLERKGVGLRDSKVPKQINDGAQLLMKEIIATIKAEQQLDLRDILKRIGDIERNIIQSVYSGSPEFMTTGQIKDGYKNGEDNPTYKQWELWRDVFAPFLGETRPPPYSVVKVSLVAGNATEINEWCEKMNNPKMAQALKAWLLKHKRKDLGTLLVPSTVVETTGIPPEITCAIDIRKIISNTMGTYYLMLESLGIFMQDKRITKLVSDMY